jgi:hypothetical protein
MNCVTEKSNLRINTSKHQDGLFMTLTPVLLISDTSFFFGLQRDATP